MISPCSTSQIRNSTKRVNSPSIRSLSIWNHLQEHPRIHLVRHRGPVFLVCLFHHVCIYSSINPHLVSPMTPSVTDNLSVTSTFTPNVTATITTAQSSGPVEPIGNTSRPTGSTGINRTLITVIATLCSIAGLTGLVVLVLFLRKNRAGTFRPGALSIMFRREKVSSEFFNDKPAFSPQPSPRLITPPSNPSPVGQAFIAQPPKGRRRGDTFRPLIIPRFGEDLNFNDHTKYNLSRPYKRI